MSEAQKTANSRQMRNERGTPDGAQGRNDEVGRSGVYPFTAPDAPKEAEVHPAGAWGQGERGGAGYQDHGGSELSYEDGQLLGALQEKADGVVADCVSGNLEIAPEEWMTFFDSFSRQHERWLATVTVTQAGQTKTEVRDCQLDGVSSDHPSARDEIYISFHRSDCGHLTHTVKNPVKVVFRRNLHGAHEGIDIASADGTLTSIRFRIAARPETLDGVVADI